MNIVQAKIITLLANNEATTTQIWRMLEGKFTRGYLNNNLNELQMLGFLRKRKSIDRASRGTLYTVAPSERQKIVEEAQLIMDLEEKKRREQLPKV
jgi:hypothetical protein